MIEQLYLLRMFTRSLYQFPGIRKVSKLIQRYYADSDYQFWIDNFDQDIKIQTHLADHIGSNVFWFGTYSGGQLHVLQSLLSPEDVFFDVGANIGVFTLFTAKRVPFGAVYSFEPVSDMFDSLSKNTQKNGFTNTHLYKFGLWDEETTRNIFIPDTKSKDGSINAGETSLFKPNASANVRAEQISLVRLDTFVEREQIHRLDHIKIDIEGAELFALHGAEYTLQQFRPNIFIEIDQESARAAGYQAADIFRYLRSFKYDFYEIKFNGKTTPINEHHLGSFQNVLCTPLS